MSSVPLKIRAKRLFKDTPYLLEKNSHLLSRRIGGGNLIYSAFTNFMEWFSLRAIENGHLTIDIIIRVECIENA